MPHSKKGSYAPETMLIHLGRNSDKSSGFVNLPPYRGSTILHSPESFFPDDTNVTYGRRDNPLVDELLGLWSRLENGASAVATSSGLSACATSLLSHLKAGDHALVTDGIYPPTRHFCDVHLARYGVSVTYYDPTARAEEIEALFRPNTTVIYMETPSSHFYELHDVPAIVALAKKHGAYTICDNTWGTPLSLRPLDLGVDVACLSATKYPCGHADTLFGIACANERAFPALKAAYGDLGLTPSPDDAYVILRGLRTMPLRLRAQHEASLKTAQWLESHPRVSRVFHPALPSHPQHAIFKRDFNGGGGVFSFALEAASDEKTLAFLRKTSELFGLGYSWGGYESLLIPFYPQKIRTLTRSFPNERYFRIQIGLENVQDLIEHLESALRVMYD